MALYVDQVVTTEYGAPDQSGEERTRWCHLLADTRPELHAAARQLGLRHNWYQQPDRGVHWHYLISARQRVQAIRLGATELNRAGLAALIKRRRTDQQAPALASTDARLLVWRDHRHFARTALPCVLCGRDTQLRSHRREPVHKVCAEKWLHSRPDNDRFVSDPPARRGDAGLHA
jgi:hypothetical protein